MNVLFWVGVGLLGCWVIYALVGGFKSLNEDSKFFRVLGKISLLMCIASIFLGILLKK